MAWPRHDEATPGQPVVASARGGLCSLALEGLESQAASPSLHGRGSRHQRVEITLLQVTPAEPHSQAGILSRAQRAHYRLSWEERLLRNARAPTIDRPTIKLFGVPEPFAAFLGLPTA